LPGMVDLHVHAPQWPQSGKALDVPLETWLQEYTFPLEARYGDAGFATSVYDSVVRTLLANGTTTAMYFGTIHAVGNQVLAERCLALGQRALVGKVAMDEPSQCPPYYKDDSAAEGIAETARFIDWLRQHPDNAQQRVLPVITPRFIPSCTDELLRGLATWLDALAPMCKPIAPRATGRMPMCWNARAAPMRMRCMISACSRAARSWPMPTSSRPMTWH